MARVFVVGDNIHTDQLAPGQYMRGGIQALARHCLEAVRPDFASSVEPGGVIAAGRSFGAGSSRKRADEALLQLGVAAVIATSIAGIFRRRATNLGLPVHVAPETGDITDGKPCVLDLDAATLSVTERQIAQEPIPPKLQFHLLDGGLVPHLSKRFAENRK